MLSSLSPPDCIPLRCRKVSPRIRQYQTPGERDLLLSPTLKLNPLTARVRQLDLATLKAEIVSMQQMIRPYGDPYSMCFQEAKLKLCPRERMLYGAHGSTDRLNTSDKPNSVICSPFVAGSSPRHALHLGFPSWVDTQAAAPFHDFVRMHQTWARSYNEAKLLRLTPPLRGFLPSPPCRCFYLFALVKDGWMYRSPIDGPGFASRF